MSPRTLKQFSWQGLYDLIKGRKTSPKEGSYTTYLFEKGKEKILKKVGEECTEVHHRRPQGGQGGDDLRDRGPCLPCDGLMIELGISVEDIPKSWKSAMLLTIK